MGIVSCHADVRLVVEREIQAMAGLMPIRWPGWPWPCACVVVLALLGWPAPACAGWFVRDNQIAFDLSREGHDRQALKHWDRSAEGWYGRGTALLHLGRAQEAEQAFRLSLALAPHKTGFSDQRAMPAERKTGFMASLWYNLGNALYAQGRLAEARQAWLSALRFRPGHAKARHNLEIVDRLLKQREDEPQALAGLTANKRKQAGGDKSPKGGAPQQQQPNVQHGLLPMHGPGSSGKAGSPGASGSGKKQGGTGASRMASSRQEGRGAPHRSSHPAAPGSGHAAGQGRGHQRAQPPGGKGMSPAQASKELGMINEGISVFLRHRLQEKPSEAESGSGGEPW
jgi:hypothetical protein